MPNLQKLRSEILPVELVLRSQLIFFGTAAVVANSCVVLPKAIALPDSPLQDQCTHELSTRGRNQPTRTFNRPRALYKKGGAGQTCQTDQAGGQ